MKKNNLLVIGASGGVATVFLEHLAKHRSLFGKLILLSRKNRIKSNNFINHKKLDYIYIEKRINPNNKKEYQKILKEHEINIVLDLTDLESLPLLEATNEMGISYINTSMNADNKTVAELIFDIYPRKKKINKAVHFLCAGMNPGIVNMWVRYGISKFGIPREIIHFEYDTSFSKKTSGTKKLSITWSPHEFLVENVRDPSGIAIGKGKIKILIPNAVNHCEDMKSILSPIMKMKNYPCGFTVLHEENMTVSYKYDIPSKFIYSVNDRTMDSLIKICKKRSKISEEDFIVMRNTDIPLDGADNIGVMLIYDDKKVYYFNSMKNSAMKGTNATYFQVVIGIFSALFTLLFDKMKRGVYFTEDLFDTNYKNYMFNNMKVEEFVFKKQKIGLKLVSHDSRLSSAKAFKSKNIHI